jgi:outer membrane protein assembly factor BamB
MPARTESMRAGKTSRKNADEPFDELGLGGSPKGQSPKGLYRLGGDKKRGGKRRKSAGKQWDSPLILFGGGALGLLVVAAVLLWFLLFREQADELLADANNLFESGSYALAIDRYGEFAEKFPSHKDASRARVQREMTRLWQSVEGAADPSASLALAKEVIAEVEDEPAFISGGEEGQELSQGKQDFGVLLARIGDSLVDRAEASSDPKQIETLIADIEATLDLSSNTKYLPEKSRNNAAFAKIGDDLGVIRTRQARDSHLAETLAKMDDAIGGGDTAKAYAARLDLLAEYPALADDAALVEKVRATSDAERARVKFVPGDVQAETAWPSRPVVAELALAERRGAAGAAASGEPLVFRVEGSLYGVRSGDGALLWRRFAGYGDTGAPVLVADGGVVASDLAGGELWRLDAATGKLVWRLPLADRVTGVTPAGDVLLATSESGKLYVVGAADGALHGSVEFSQPIRTAPGVNDRGDRIYVVAEHSIIYTLAASDFSCVGVYYLGHAAGAVAAPPVAVLNKVIVADNTGTNTCLVRVLSLDDNGAVAGEAAGDRLTGLALTPLARAARRIVATTTAGQVGVYEIGGASDATALTVVARRTGQDREPLARFALVHDGKLWLAGRELQKLTVLPTENQLTVEAMDQDFHGDVFDAPLAAAGRYVISLRRPKGRAGAIVAATDATANRTAWETELAVPLAGAPAVDSARLRATAVVASGAVYVLDRDSMVRGVQDQAARAEALIGSPPPLTTIVETGDGALAAGAAGSADLLIVRPDDPRQAVRKVSLLSPLAGALTAWQGRIVCPTEVGQVFLVDSATGAPAGTPFQPELTPGQKYRWLAAAATGEGDGAALALSDGVERLYLVRQVATPAPHLEMVQSVDVGPSPLVTPLATVGTSVIAGTQDGRLAAFALPELKPAEPVELGGRVVWGPFPAGDGALVATDAGELLLIGADAAIVWRREPEHGELAGRPLVKDGAALMIHAQGGLAQINLASGAETGYAEIGQSAVAGPVPLGERVVVAAPDGALLVVNRP